MRLVTLFIILFILYPFSLFGQWVPVLELPGGTPSQAFIDNGNGRLYLASIGEGGVYSSTNNGVNWVFSNNGINSNLIYAISAKDSIVFVSTQNGIYRSSNYGNTFVHMLNDIDSGRSDANMFKDNIVFAGVGFDIYRSTNLGNNWVLINNELPQYPNSISMTFSNNMIFVGIRAFPGSGVFSSSNYGDNWININNNMPVRYPYSLYANENLIMMGTWDGVYISPNSGNNWRLIPEVPGNIGLFGLSSIGAETIFISAWNYGVYVSTNGGLNWVSKNEGLYSDLRLTCLYTLNGYVYVGTNSYQYYPNIFRRPVSELVPVIENNAELPNDFKLHQNYPNPFNPETKIRFEVPLNQGRRASEEVGLKGVVSLKVFDILGKEIATLVNKPLNPGTYEVTFDGSNLPSGVYFYRLTTDGFSETKKMVIMK